MSIVEEGLSAPVSSLAVIDDLRKDLERSDNSVNFWTNRAVEFERRIDNVAGYLRDCLDTGDSPDLDTIADYLDIDLQREFAVNVDVTFQFTIKAKNEDEAQEMADSIYFTADGDYESDEYEVTSIDVNEV
jgi:hypothetical protein